MAFEKWEQIITLQDIEDFSSVSNGELGAQTQKQFDTKYELLATIFQSIHYGELFSTEDGTIRTDIPAHSLNTLKKALIHLYFYTGVTIELWDTLKLEGSTDLDGGRTQLNTWDPDNLFDALPLITKEFIDAAGIKNAIAEGDFQSLIESDPTEFVAQEQFNILVAQVVQNTEDIKNITLGNIRTGLIPTESSEESYLETEGASQQDINIENAIGIRTLNSNVAILEDAVNNKLLRTSRSIDFEPISVTGATSYVLGFTNYTSDFFDSAPVTVNPGSANERIEYRVFTLKEGVTLKKDVPVDIPINLDFTLTGATTNETGKIRIFINGVPTNIGEFKFAGTTTNEINFYKVFRITPTVDLTSLSFYIDAIVTVGGFTAVMKNTSYMEVQIETVVGVPNDIFNAIYPIGCLFFGVNSPSKGTWISKGILQEGQTIVGGLSSNGEVIEHRHNLSGDTEKGTFLFNPSVSQTTDPGTMDVASDSGTGLIAYDNTTAHVAYAYRTAVTGGSKNKAYGLGVGDGIHVWQRTA